jgi:hypothetical protein
MENIEKLIAEYSVTGHSQYPEESYDLKKEISNVDELYQFMKEIHKRDAYNFNDFPLNGGCSKNCFVFYIQKSIIFNGEEYIAKKIKTEHPTYFLDAVKMYQIFNERLHSTLPNLRKAKEKRIKENLELETLKFLKSKYEKQ